MQCQIGFRDNIWKSSRLSELLSQLGCRGYFHPPGKCPINSILYLKRAIAHARASIRATGLICVKSTTHYFNFWHFTIVFFVIWTRCSQMKINNYLLILIPHLKLPVFVGNKAKGRMSKRVFQENKARQIFRRNELFLLSDTHMGVSGGKKCSFWGKFGVLCFLETPVLRFALLPYYRVLMHSVPKCSGIL